MDRRIGNWMQTSQNVQFWPLDPRPEEILIEDIAHALAHQCRFAGHCLHFYSVAQHSVLVQEILKQTGAPQELQLAGLLHDASEAYLVDLPRPIKTIEEFGIPYKIAEARLEVAIAERFDISLDLFHDPRIKRSDNVALATERRDLMGRSPAPWDEIEAVEPAPIRVVSLAPYVARNEFLTAFGALHHAMWLQKNARRAGC